MEVIVFQYFPVVNITLGKQKIDDLTFVIDNEKKPGYTIKKCTPANISTCR